MLKLSRTLCICIVLYVVEDLEIDWIESFVFWELVLQQEGEDMRTDCHSVVVSRKWLSLRVEQGRAMGDFFFLRGRGWLFTVKGRKFPLSLVTGDGCLSASLKVRLSLSLHSPPPVLQCAKQRKGRFKKSLSFLCLRNRQFKFEL